MTYRHIVLFKIHDEVSDEDFQKAVETLKQLGENNPDILEWKVNVSLDNRKGRVIIEEATFTNEEAFQKFRVSQKHINAGNIMKEISDWFVGDYSG